MVSVLEMATEERRDLLAFLRTLDEAQWDAPTLCHGWTVRDVVAHVVSYDTLSRAGLATRAARGGLRLSTINALGVAGAREASPAVLLDALKRNLRPRGLTTAFGGRIALADGVIHHQDIRRPLGLPRTIPPERLRAVLSFAPFALPIRGPWRVLGIKLVATDLDWSFGRGPEARGPGEALLMAIAGRRGAAAELTGPGADRLRARSR
jgi:uncharacterized protein (TIGR03083 family)